MKNRNSRQIEFFGNKGQEIINKLSILVVGAGGLGSHIIQQLAFLGVRKIVMIDDQALDLTNTNRLIGYKYGDILSSESKKGDPKIDIGKRTVNQINPNINVIGIDKNLISKEGLEAIKKADFVFGGLDNDGARLFLNEVCLAYEVPLIDCATEILPDVDEFGGRIVFMLNSRGCLYCSGQIDPDQAGEDLENENARFDRKAIYGLSDEELDRSGPSVVSINGIIASLAITEFLVFVTGIKKPSFILKYYGSQNRITKINPPDNNVGCIYCNSIRGIADEANWGHYFKL